MRHRARVTGLVLTAALAAARPALAQTPHLLIVVGLSGDPEHGALFSKWGDTLADVAVQQLGVPKADVIYLADDPAQDAHATGRSTRAEVEKAFAALATAGEDDTVMVVLFGFGTFDGSVAKFNLRGPDMTPQDFAALLGKLPSKRVVFVDTTSASGPFVEVLSGPGRTIVTATRNGAEHFATLFGGFFVDAFKSDAADTDHSGRVSVLEAYVYAKREVANAYQREGLMQTEHPLLDDNGDREGSADPGPQAKDGRVAAILSLGEPAHAAPAANASPQLRALYVERDGLERRVESLKLLKGSMDQARYASELEKLLTDLAVTSKKIRDLGGS
ncbi:MAG TPA: hypothetical protein VFX12_15680 [Vicinamibacterales bacterium]|nr:hypothetical protein [Vicinamibacterales bacterium]